MCLLAIFFFFFIFCPFSGPATLLEINSVDFISLFLWDLGLNQPSGAVLNCDNTVKGFGGSRKDPETLVVE